MDDEPKANKEMTSAEIEAYVQENFGAVEEVEPDLFIPEIGVVVSGVFKGTRVDDLGEGDERESILVEAKTGLLRIPAGVNLQRKVANLTDGDQVVVIRMKDGVSNTGRTFKNWKVFKVKG